MGAGGYSSMGRNLTAHTSFLYQEGIIFNFCLFCAFTIYCILWMFGGDMSRPEEARWLNVMILKPMWAYCILCIAYYKIRLACSSNLNSTFKFLFLFPRSVSTHLWRSLIELADWIILLIIASLILFYFVSIFYYFDSLFLHLCN